MNYDCDKTKVFKDYLIVCSWTLIVRSVNIQNEIIKLEEDEQQCHVLEIGNT